MKKNEEKVLYNTREWLNQPTTPSTGSVVCFHGICHYPEDKDDWENMFLEVSDCHVKARLHKTTFETKEDFIQKLKLLKTNIINFIEHLENE